jgi:hypothetical protein
MSENLALLLIIALPISVIVLSYYIIRIAGKHKALMSISNSDYWLVKPWKWTFEAVMFITGFSIMFISLYLKEKTMITLFISGIGIFGVGIFARYEKNIFFKIAHNICAVVGYGTFIASFKIDFNNWWFIGVQAVIALWVYLYSIDKEKGILIWNLEVSLLYTISSCYFPLIAIEVLKSV